MNKPVLTRGLLLVPLVDASSSLTNALGVWLAWVLISFGHGWAMTLAGPRCTTYQRLVAAILLAAALSACASLVAQAWLPEWSASSSLYLGWIALSCVALDQAPVDESRVADRLRLAGQSGLLMAILSALRELIGNGVPLALLAPGGFILLGLLLAAHQAWTASKPHPPLEETPRP